MKFLILLFVSFSVLANIQPSTANKSLKTAPKPDIRERAEMACFDSSLAMFSALKSIRSGSSPERMIVIIKLNSATAKNDAKGDISLITRIDAVTRLALNIVSVAKDLDRSITPESAQAVYYNSCVKGVNEYLDENIDKTIIK